MTHLFDPMSYGPFHRLANPRTQNRRTALNQTRSGEVWGRTPLGGCEPTIQAYTGILPPGREGIQFVTEVEPTTAIGTEVR